MRAARTRPPADPTLFIRMHNDLAAWILTTKTQLPDKHRVLIKVAKIRHSSTSGSFVSVLTRFPKDPLIGTPSALILFKQGLPGQNPCEYFNCLR